MIPEYGNTEENYSSEGHYSYWCGSYALSWIYYTKIDRGDPSGNYDYFLTYTANFSGERPMFPWQMFWSMAQASNWKIWVMPWFSSGRHSAYWFVRGKHNPVVILTRWGTHWKVGYGAYRRGWKKWPSYYFATKDNDIDKLHNRHDKASWFFLYLKVYD